MSRITYGIFADFLFFCIYDDFLPIHILPSHRLIVASTSTEI